jgi:hypothetical protein
MNKDIMLNRKQLPNFGILKNIRIDISCLLVALQKNDLLDTDQYNDINVSKDGKYSNFTKTNSYSKTSFFTEDNSLNGEQYKQLYLTDPEDSIKDLVAQDKKTEILYRTKRLNPKHKDYDPVADELNYGKRNEFCINEIHEILNKFSEFDKITRVRLALLKSHFSIKPHIDYDPSYIVRYHIPLITNEDCKLNCMKGDSVYSTHFKADGHVYFLNTGHKHWASNDSDYDRIHLIVDVHGQNLLQFVEEYH